MADISIAKLAWLHWWAEQEENTQDNINLYREYYDGEQNVKLSERQEEYLQGVDAERFCINMCPIVVDSMINRLNVTGFDVSMPPSEQDDEAQEGGEQDADEQWSSLLNEWWQDNRGDALQRKNHKAAGRDGESFLIVGFNKDAGRPTLNWQPRFACYGDNANNGTGVKIHYDGDDVIFATKRWTQTYMDEEGHMQERKRMTAYFPDRIEKYAGGIKAKDENLEPYDEEDDGVWPLPWVDLSGKPLGVPVVPFINNAKGYNEGESELKAVIPLQDAANKALVDMIADADYSAFPVKYQTGGDKPDGNIFPGALLYNEDPNTKFGVIPGSSSTNYIEQIDALVRWCASVTATPQYMFFPTGQVPSGEALRTAESGLLAKVADRQVGWGNGYEDAMHMAIKLANTFGDFNIPEGLLITCIWDNASQMTADEQRAKSEFMSGLGYEEEALRIMGYDDTEIEKLLEEKANSNVRQANIGAAYANEARRRMEQTPVPEGAPAIARMLGNQNQQEQVR